MVRQVILEDASRIRGAQLEVRICMHPRRNLLIRVLQDPTVTPLEFGKTAKVLSSQ